MNIALDDTLAAVAALTKNGVGTSQAINGLKAVMSNVIKPTTEAGKAAKQLGLDFSATALESKGLSGFLSDVMEKTGGDTEVGGAVGFIGESYRQALLDAQIERAALTKERTEAVSALREASAGEEEMNRAVADYKVAMAALDSKDAQAAADMMAGYNEIFAGVARQNPEQAAWLEQASETITKLGELKAALDCWTPMRRGAS